jgi:TonB family protein
VHIAIDRFRRDQELACDEAVIRRHPDSRRAYGEAMLKTQLADGALPFGCHWRGEHPLKERIAMLKRPTPSRRQWFGGAFACALLAMLTGFSVWAAQPATRIGQGDVRYVVERKTFIDEKSSGNLTQHFPAGVTMTSVVGQGAARWENAMTVAPGPLSGQVAVRMQIRNGDPAKIVATPTAIVREGETGSVEQGAYIHEFRVVREGEPLPRNAPAAAADSLFNAPGAAPLDTRLQGMSGKVVLLVDVAADGSYKAARVETSEPKGVFDAAALEAVKTWKFNPARKDGKSVEGQASVTFFWDAGMKTAEAPPGRKDGDQYNWSTIDRRTSRIVPEGTCQVLIPVNAHVVTCGQKKTTVLQ